MDRPIQWHLLHQMSQSSNRLVIRLILRSNFLQVLLNPIVDYDAASYRPTSPIDCLHLSEGRRLV